MTISGVCASVLRDLGVLISLTTRRVMAHVFLALGQIDQTHHVAPSTANASLRSLTEATISARLPPGSRPGLRAEQKGAPLRDQARTTALPGLAGTTAVLASSALIVRARTFRAWLEPLIPSLRRARLDTGLPLLQA